MMPFLAGVFLEECSKLCVYIEVLVHFLTVFLIPHTMLGVCV